MRLIDADALMSGFDVRKVVEYDESGCGWIISAVPVKAIVNAPTIDAEPVRHGRWEEPYPHDIYDCYKCSCCGDMYERTWNFCPNRGAKMRGDEDATE